MQMLDWPEKDQEANALAFFATDSEMKKKFYNIETRPLKLAQNVATCKQFLIFVKWIILSSKLVCFGQQESSD
jgi:hypothetical protein